MSPPPKLKYQKETGMTLSFFFSEAIHCRRKRIVNMACPMKPKIIQKSMLNFGYCWAKLERTSFTQPISNPVFNVILNGTMLHPPHPQEVDKRSHHTISNIIFRFPKLPRMVCHGNLDDSISLHFNERGEKPVHPIKHPNLL